MKSFKIIYTSDVHGQLGATYYPRNTIDMMGLSRLATFLKNQQEYMLYLDNGDLLQGSPLMDYSRLNNTPKNPAATAMNLLNASYITLGNHDFNYGLPYLKEYISQVNATLLCANVFMDHKPLGESIVIDSRFGVKVGFIGVTTAYVPHWEQEEFIRGLTFNSASETVARLVAQHRSSVDLMVVVYHGGFEKNPATQLPIGRQTIENEAAAISVIPGVDVLLTGHQHVSMEYQNQTPKLLQPAMNAKEFGVVDVVVKEQQIVDVKVALVQNTFSEDSDYVEQFRELETNTSNWLDQTIGYVESDLRVSSVLDVRKQPHRLVDWIHQLQRSTYDTDISVVSLPNDMAGFQGKVTVRNLSATFVFANTLTVLSMSGRAILEALEQTATYFEVEDGQLITSPNFLSPKVEHYNYDMYQGIEYVFNISKPVGHRVVKCTFAGNPLDETHFYRVICNNYRASGGGDYEMFEAAEVLVEIDKSYFDMASDFIKKFHPVTVELISNFTVKTTD